MGTVVVQCANLSCSQVVERWVYRNDSELEAIAAARPGAFACGHCGETATITYVLDAYGRPAARPLVEIY